jgi:hypothetical protein
MTSTESIVKLTGPENWKEWNLRFINMAQDNQLWELINPKSPARGDFMERPCEPKVVNYPKLLNTPASSTPAISATLEATPELVDAEGRPRNLSEMTTAGKEQYRQDMVNFQFNWRRYETQGQRISNISNWVQKTVATHIYNATCKHDKKLHEWYASLKERAGTDDLEDLRRALECYNNAIKPLSRKPKDMATWLSSWETAIGEAQEAKVPGTDNSQMWWLQFEATIRNAGYDSWCEAYAISNQELINTNKMTVHKLVKDFRERLRKTNDSKPSTIAKGAFLSYNGHTPDGEDERRSRKRSRSPRNQQGNKRRRINCPACDRSHSLEECWAARPETRPDFMPDEPDVEQRVRERIDRNPELMKQVQALRKHTKKKEKDNPSPTKGALKEGKLQVRFEDEH